MKTKFKLLPLMAAIFVIVALLVPVVVIAAFPTPPIGDIPVPPCRFYGDVYIKDKPAHAGLAVVAYIHGYKVATGKTTTGGKYGWVNPYYIPSYSTSTPKGGHDGDVVVFKVANIQAYPAGFFETGGIRNHNLYRNR